MRKKRIYNGNKGINPAALVVFLLCLGLYWLHFSAYYKNGGSVYDALLFMEFPYIHAGSDQSTAPAQPQSTPAPQNTDIKIEVISTEPPMVSLDGKEPKILIYHTHTTEAYLQTDKDKYEESGKWRTRDNDKNVVAVGEKLAECLRSYGIAVIHDTTDHEPPKLATSYSRSLKTMEKYRDKYPSITMYIDLHRDSFGKNPTEPADFVTINGRQCARLMFVVGTGKGATGTGYGQMPDFDSNYALAERITNTLKGIDPGLTRDIRVKPGRYNQHVSNQCLLVEVGHNANTFEQALNSIDYLAAAIAEAAGLTACEGQLSLSP